MERRKFPRYPFVAYVEVTEEKPSRVRIKARTSDIGRDGCYVDTIAPFQAGAEVSVKIMKNEQTFSTVGVVVHSSIGWGMGVQFTSIPSASVLVIERWIREQSGEIPEGSPDEPDESELVEQLEAILEKLSMRRK